LKSQALWLESGADLKKLGTFGLLSHSNFTLELEVPKALVPTVKYFKVCYKLRYLIK
jgi:hypothetical protein